MMTGKPLNTQANLERKQPALWLMWGKTLKLPCMCFVCKPEFERELMERICRAQFGFFGRWYFESREAKSCCCHTNLSYLFSCFHVLWRMSVLEIWLGVSNRIWSWGWEFAAEVFLPPISWNACGQKRLGLLGIWEEGGKGTYPSNPWVERMYHCLVAREASFHNL